jgi:hypothetical protein
MMQSIPSLNNQITRASAKGIGIHFGHSNKFFKLKVTEQHQLMVRKEIP